MAQYLLMARHPVERRTLWKYVQDCLINYQKYMHATTNYKTNSFPKYKYHILFEKLNVKSLLYARFTKQA